MVTALLKSIGVLNLILIICKHKITLNLCIIKITQLKVCMYIMYIYIKIMMHKYTDGLRFFTAQIREN